MCLTVPPPSFSKSWALSWCGMCVYARVYTRVHNTRPGQSGWGGSCVLALCILLWADGICLVPLLCQVTHPSVDLGWGFREGVCFPGVCLMVNLMEMAPTGPSGSLATRPLSVPEPCLLSLLGRRRDCWFPGGHHFPEGHPHSPCLLSLFPQQLESCSLTCWLAL